MKDKFKKMIPCILAGVAGIGYGNTNSNEDVSDTVKISENKLKN